MAISSKDSKNLHEPRGHFSESRNLEESTRIPQRRPPKLNLVNRVILPALSKSVFSVRRGDVIWSNEANYLHHVDLNVATGILPSN